MLQALETWGCVYQHILLVPKCHLSTSMWTSLCSAIVCCPFSGSMKTP